MYRRLPPLNALRAFEAAGRHESFSRAAEELGVSHSAISRHVRGLEARMKTQLFRDLPRGVALTAAGAQFLAQLSPAFDRIAAAAESFEGGVKGRVRLNVEPVFATKWLMPRLPQFEQQHPDIELQIEASEFLADIDRFEADLALRFYKTGIPDRPTDLISTAPLFPYGAPGLIPLPLVHPEVFLQFRLYQDRRGPMWQNWFDAAGADSSQVPEYTFRMRSALAVEAAVNRMGILLASSDVMAYEVEIGRLEQLSDIPLYSGSYHLLVGESATRSKPVRVFRDWLLEQTSDLRGAPERPD